MKKYEETINAKIALAERDKSQVKRDLITVLDYFKEYIEKDTYDDETMKIIFMFFCECKTLDRELQTLYDIKNKVKAE